MPLRNRVTAHFPVIYTKGKKSTFLEKKQIIDNEPRAII